MLISCSRSAHDQNVLARRPQWDQNGCHSKREKRASLEGSIKWMTVARCAQWGIHQATPVWPVSLVPHVSHVSHQRNYARSEGQPFHPWLTSALRFEI